MQYQFSCAPKLARKCEIEHWLPCGAGGRSGGHLITKISRMGRLPNFLTHGAPLRARGAPLLSSRQRYYVSVDKTTLELAGIGLSRFKPHSIRSASASAAAGSC